MKYIVYMEKDSRPGVIFIVDVSAKQEYIYDNGNMKIGTDWNLHLEYKSNFSFEKYIEITPISFYTEIEMDSPISVKELLPELWL